MSCAPTTYAEVQAAAERLRDVLRAKRIEAEFERAMTVEQRHQRALFEARMRANRLRGLPSVFGDLDEEPSRA